MKTYDEINQALLRHLPEEMNDILEYHQLASDLEELGCADCKFVIEIAKDEMLHANWIYEHLKESGVQIPQDISDKFHQLEMAHK